MHSDAKEERLRIRLSATLKDRLETWAERRDKNVSAYVRGALQEKINDEILKDLDLKTDAKR